jgi:hypothetical protein
MLGPIIREAIGHFTLRCWQAPASLWERSLHTFERGEVTSALVRLVEWLREISGMVTLVEKKLG